MNLKEAFRMQNKLQTLMDEAQCILFCDANVTRVENTHLRKKVMAETENETTVEQPDSDYADRITELTGFLLHLLSQHESLTAAIRAAKNRLPLDMDSEVSLNTRRQGIAACFKHLVELRNSELLLPHGGVGYRFNTDGNQVAYKCDLRQVTTINFDRNVVRRGLAALNRQADEVSRQLDRCLVNAEVDYTPAFDVNDSFAAVFEAYLSQTA